MRRGLGSHREPETRASRWLANEQQSKNTRYSALKVPSLESHPFLTSSPA